jgi:hypothetical protein
MQRSMMPTKIPADYLNYWIELINRRGHSSIFATTNKTKKLVELSIAREFSKSLKYEFSIILENVTNCETDPPDCLAEVDGRKMQIELVELIDQSAIHIARKKGLTAHNDSKQFLATQWSSDRLIEEVNRVIDAKDKKYKLADKKIEILLIYTAEAWLSPNDAKRWIFEQTFEALDSFESVFLLMEYDPSYSQTHWPLFQLCGEGLGDKIST